MSDSYSKNLQLSLKNHSDRLSSDLRSRADLLLDQILRGEKSTCLYKTVFQLHADANVIDRLGIL